MSSQPGRFDRGGNAEPFEDEQLKQNRERRNLLNEITQRTRYDIIQTILMHPKQMPSLDEIVYMHPDRSKSTLREHLENLIELNVVKKAELPKERQSRDAPRVFFGLTEEGRQILDDFGLLDIEDTLQYLYENMEKPSRIEELEEAPRPS